jgi:hypothetical protein
MNFSNVLGISFGLIYSDLIIAMCEILCETASRVGKRRTTMTFHVFDDRHAPFAHADIRQYPQTQYHCRPNLTDKYHF